MRAFVLLSVLLLSGPCLSLRGETLDRIVAVIDHRFIITQSDIRKERAIQEVLGADPGSDDMILDALVERRLVEEQIGQFRDIRIPDDLAASRLRELPAASGAVSSDDLRAAVTGELRRAEFFNQRFRQFIRATDEELRRYYQQVYVPELRKRGVQAPPIEQGLADVEPNVIAEKMNEEVSVWLEDLRRRTIVEKIPE